MSLQQRGAMHKQTFFAKIARPRPQNVLYRARLFKLLDKGRASPLTWVSGPGGSGKTTLAASWLDAKKIPNLWYRIDDGDGDLSTFFYYLGLAAKKAAPRSKPLPLLTPEYLMGVPVFTRTFFEQLSARFKGPAVLVFDNYQDAPEGSPLHEVIRQGLSAVPEGISFVVISRCGPPASLVDVRAKNGMNSIAWDDLRFTESETRGVLKLLGKKQALKAAGFMHEKTNGWAAGLILMTEGGSAPGPGPASDQQSRERLFDYFAGEVFAGLDAKTRDFLLLSSLIPSMTEKTAAKLTDNEQAGRILQWLTSNNLFTERGFSPETVYRYHPLFREFLLTRAREAFNPEGLLCKKNSAASILEEAGNMEDAALIYRETQNWDRYIPLVLGQARALITQGRSATLSEWLSAVPGEIAEQVPWLWYWKGACIMPFNPQESQRCFERAFALFKKENDVPGEFLAWAGIVDSIFLAGFDYSLMDAWFEELDELRELHPEFPSVEIEVLVTNSMFGGLLYRQTSRARLDYWAGRLEALLPAIADNRLKIMSAAYLVNYYDWFGQSARESQVMEALRSYASARDTRPLELVYLHTVEAMYCWSAAADFARCREAVDRGLETAETTGVHFLDNLLLFQGIYGALSAGDAVQGADLLRRVKAMPGTRRIDAAHYHFLAGWEAFLRGDSPAALEHAQRAVSLTEAVGMPFPLAISHAALAAVFISRKRFTEAQESISNARRINHDRKSPHPEHMCLWVEAWLALERRDEAKCLLLLKAAFAVGKRQAFINHHLWLPNVMSRLCARALDAGIEVEYLQGLIRKRDLLPDEASLTLENWPWPVRIYTLGDFQIVTDARPLHFHGKTPKKPLDLLKALVAFGGREVAVEALSDELWPDADGDAAQKALEINLIRLRRLLGDDRCVLLHNGRLTLNRRVCWVDVWALENILTSSEALEAGSSYPGLAQKAMALFRGRFLAADSSAAWAEPYRERVQSRLLRLLSKAGQHWEQAGNHEKAIECFGKGLEIDELSEELYQRLMSCLYNNGRKAEAVKAYRRCAQALSSGLGITPSSMTEALYQSIIAGKA